MGDIEAAILRPGLFTLAFLVIVAGVWWHRRPRVEHAGPKLARVARESRFPRLSRKEPEIEAVEIAPSRLARVSGTAPLAPLPDSEYGEPEADSQAAIDPDTPTDGGAAADENARDAVPDSVTAPDVAAQIAADTAAKAVPETPVETSDDTLLGDVILSSDAQPDHAAAPYAAVDSVALVPRIPPCGGAPISSWLGGRPRLPETMDWPKADGRDGDFLAQISCADLSPQLWDGLGPRTGWLAFFANPDSGALTVLHLAHDGPPRDPPHRAGVLWAGPVGDIATLAIRAFPEWPVDLIIGATDCEPAAAGHTRDIPGVEAQEYDIADPAFHPFDWDSMLAMAAILEGRLGRLPVDGIAPGDANDELALAMAEAAATNREAHARAQEIIAVIRESAGQGSFSPADAAAVMAGLHAVRWSEVLTRTDPESGEDRVETLTLPLTRHHPEADLWVKDYRALLADHAKHAWCADDDRLSPAARAQFEPEWHALATCDMATLGAAPAEFAANFDPELDAVLITLPASRLMSRGPALGASTIVAIRKVDLATGDFSRLKLLQTADGIVLD